MKKTAIFALALLCVLGIAGYVFAGGSRPYKNLEETEIASATVHLTPPDKTVQIEDIAALTELLRDVVNYRKDDSYTEYSGQGVTFTLTMADGSRTDITAYNPFLIMDGVGYKTKYEPCEALNHYANSLLNSETAAIIQEEPPTLRVASGETAETALLGSYSWERVGEDGVAETVIADGAHPLDCQELLSPLETEESTATLHFAEEPDAILSVCCWRDAHWGEIGAGSEAVQREGNAFELRPGGYVYQVVARWDTERGCGGTAVYAVYIISA